MPVRRTAPLLLLALAAVFPAGRAVAQAEGSLEIKVTDTAGAPIADVPARVDGVRRGQTDAQGRLKVGGLPPGWHALKVGRIGLRGVALGVMLPPGGEGQVEVVMEPLPVAVGPVVAAARPRHGTFALKPPRGEHVPGGGVRFTRHDVEMHRPTRLSQLLVLAPGVELLPGPDGTLLRIRRAFAARREFVGALPPPDCTPAFYLDGVRQARITSADVVPPEDVEEVVLYAGNVPAAYGGVRASCGVVVIRTRGAPAAAPKPRADESYAPPAAKAAKGSVKSAGPPALSFPNDRLTP